MKQILFLFSICLLLSCKEDLQIVEPTPSTTDSYGGVGMTVNDAWFYKNYPGYEKLTIRYYGQGDFNKDGYKDMVCVFATNGTRQYNYQDDESKRLVVGVFINKKTFFELDTNLVYSQLGGWNGVIVDDVNSDGYLDMYQMTGGWEGTPKLRPSYYNAGGNGAMDSFLFVNQANKGFKKIVAKVDDEISSIMNSIIFDNDRNGYSEIYLSNGDYYDFDGQSLVHKKLNIVKTFKGVDYDLRVITPKYVDKQKGLLFLASDRFTDTYFILKVVGNDLIPIIKYDVPFSLSGFSEGTNGERDEMYVEDLDKDGKLEYVIPSQIFNTSNTKTTPYLLIVDSDGNDVTGKFLDSSINNPLKPNQFNGDVSTNYVTGFIYYTFADIDGDSIQEIFAASGLGYLENNNRYYFKLTNGKYTKVLYQTGWIGNVNVENKTQTYWPFVDEKNKITIFHISNGPLNTVNILTY